MGAERTRLCLLRFDLSGLGIFNFGSSLNTLSLRSDIASSVKILSLFRVWGLGLDLSSGEIRFEAFVWGFLKGDMDLALS